MLFCIFITCQKKPKGAKKHQKVTKSAKERVQKGVKTIKKNCPKVQIKCISVTTKDV